MPGENIPKKSTNQFMRQGHTANIYGNNPDLSPKGQAAKPARELKP